MKRLHIILGLLTVAAFIGTGFYLHYELPPIIEHNEALRFTHRANHIYLLMSGLLNIILGTYLQPHPRPWRRTMQTLASALLLLAPLVLMAAFIIEAKSVSHLRPITAGGALLCFAGAMLHMFGKLKSTTR